MPKLKENDTGKQTKLLNFFSAQNGAKVIKTSSSRGDLFKSYKQLNETIEILDDDKTPKKSNDLKENLIKLSNQMDKNSAKSDKKFAFKSTDKSNDKPGKSNFICDADDSLDDILPLKKVEIKPQPLFKITSSKSSECSGLLNLKPKLYTSTQAVQDSIQDELKRNIYIAKSQAISRQETQKILDADLNKTTSSTSSGWSPLSNKFSFRKPKLNSTQQQLDSPEKPAESLKIIDQLSSAISNLKQSPTKLIKVDSRECLIDSNASTPEFKPEEKISGEKTNQDRKISSKINVCLDVDEMLGDVETTQMAIDVLDSQETKDAKMKFLEYYFNRHSSIPLSTYDNVKDYSKPLTLKLKGIIYALDKRQKRQELCEQNKSHVSYTDSPCSIPSTSMTEIPKIVSKRPESPRPANYRPPKYNYDDDDQFDIDTVMNEVMDEKRKSDGKFNNSYVDLTSSASSTTVKDKFEPRINLKANMPTLPATNYSNDEVDDDGFPIIDYSQLEDVVTSSSAQKPSSSHQSLSNENKKAKKDTVDSMIPDNMTGITIKSTNPVGKFHSNIKNDGITGEFDNENYEFSNELRYIFRSTFGLRNFRQNQLQAINATLLGKDCFILMPTGGGKSLCYQLTAIMSKGVTIVISPLKSLILDQVNKLKSLDIKAAALSGEISQAEIRQIYSDLNGTDPSIKLLYVTPEKISASSFFQDTLTSLHNNRNLARIVIDEAHCVSTWGHDFRPDYKKLGELKKRFPSVPVMALTATANERVRTDVVHQLNIYGCKWFLSSFNRPNLKYIVSHKTGTKTITDIINLIKSKFPRSSGIIYCLTRKETEQVAQKLQLANITANSYHAGMSDKNRERTQEDWITDKSRVICATIAFGMGIDKPDVRYVIHYSMPKSIEGYYQESGRAGRDGALSTCILYYNYSDKMRYVKMMENESQAVKQVSLNNLDLVVNFCENMVDCRRTLQLNYFGEHFTREQCQENRSSACDNCSRVLQYKNIDITEISKNLVSAVADLCNRSGLTILQLVDVFKGSLTKKITDSGLHNTKFHGCLKDWDRNDIQRILHKLVIENYLREEIVVIRDIPVSYIKVGKNVALLMTQNKKVEFSVIEKRYQAASKKVDIAVNSDDNHASKIDELCDRLYHDLMDIAKSIADERNLTIQQVMNMEALRQMSRIMPETEEEMLQIPHITKANYMKYGKRFLDAIIPYSAQRSAYDFDRLEENMQESDNDNEGDEDYSQNWEALGREASTSSSGAKKGFKRRSGTGWGARNMTKKYKRSRSGAKKKGKSPAKKRAEANSSTRGRSKKVMMPAPRPTF